ncbi:MAG: hypothetical protein JST92_26905, partial [Deltaproteobacteria bacterium]|nr:hypothetical protein [Deltaproteobacteria bacterium]
VGSSTGTTFTDTQVGAGFAYSYVISATVGACTSPYGTPVSATASGGTPPPPSNDFSIAASPASLTIAAGSNGTSSIATAITSGSAQSITLTASGLPSGVTAAFSPATLTAGGSSTLTLTASSSVASGSATVTITGTATSGSHTATIALTTTGTTPPPPPSGDLANGDFESGLTSWTATGKTSAGTSGANTGSGFAVVGSASPYNGTSTLTQSFKVPTTATPTLSFAYRTHNPGNDTLTYANQTAELHDASGATIKQFFKSVGNANAWATATFDLSAYAGQTVTLFFSATDDGYATDPVWFDVDTVTISKPAGDTTPPTASITSPAAGATVSGTVNVTATGADNVGVTKLEIFVDGASIGSSTSGSASASWNTTAASNGTHSLTAKATDAAGNSGTSAAVSVTVNNTTTPPPSSNLILNGTFENGLTSWLTGGTTAPVASQIEAHGGVKAARMGWMNGSTVASGDSYVYQWVTIPANATSATLTFWYYAFSEDSISYDYQDALIYKSDGTTVLKTIFHLGSDGERWIQRTADLSAYKGQTIAVLFNVHSDGDGMRTSMWVDDVNLTVK